MIKFTAKSELIKNHKHAEVKVANSKMQALQTSDGHALLFSIGNDGVFYVSQETPGSSLGWTTTNLSDSVVQIYRNKGRGQTYFCKSFDVAQSFNIGFIDLVLVITIDNTDYLCVSLQNPMTDATWKQPISWDPMDFGQYDITPKRVITNAYITFENNQNDLIDKYVVFDVLKDNSTQDRLLSRYHIDLMGVYFSNNPHYRPGPDIWKLQTYDTSYYNVTSHTILGMPTGYGYGTYTLQEGADSNKVYFNPIYSNNDLPYVPTEIEVIGNRNPTAIAVIKNLLGGPTSLFIACDGVVNVNGKKIYYYAPSTSGNPTSIIENDLFVGVSELYADTTATETILWGRNLQGQVFRLKCPKGQEQTPSAWSVPIPIIINATKIAPYLNRVTGHSVIFANTTDRGLIKLKQDPATKIWQERKIYLQTTDVNKIVEFESFTTHIQCTDENDLPIVEPISLKITTDSHASMYVNNQYLTIDKDSNATFMTDETGTLTIVQETHSLSAVHFKVVEPTSGVFIDVKPTTSILEKITSITSWAEFAAKKVYDELGVESNITTRTPTEQQKADFMTAITNFKNAYNKVKNPATAARNVSETTTSTWGMSFQENNWQYHEGQTTLNVFNGTNNLATRDAVLTSIDPANAIDVIAEDVFKWLKHAFTDVSDFMIHEVNNAISFLIKVGEKVYRIALDTVHAVAHAVEWFFNKIEIAWEKLKQWVGFVFNWKDIMATHGVLRNVYKLHSKQALDFINTFETIINDKFTHLQAEIAVWTDLNAVPIYSDTASTTNKQKPQSFTTPQANYGTHHYKNHYLELGSTKDLPIVAPDESIFDAILAIIESDLATFVIVKDRLYNEVIVPFHTLTLTEILKRIMGILAIQTLEIVKRTLIGIINIFKNKLQNALNSLSKPIEFPVLSWLYHKYTGFVFNVEDAVCMVCAISSTVVYKIEELTAPFIVGDPLTTRLQTVTTLADFQSMYSTVISSRSVRDTAVTSITVRDVFTTLLGFAAIPATIVLIKNNKNSTGNLIKGIIPILNNDEKNRTNLYNCIANIFYVSPNFPGTADGAWYQIMNTTLTYLSVAKGIAAIYFNGEKSVKVLNWMEFGLNVIWNVPPAFNIHYNKNNASYKGLIVESISDYAFNLGGMITPWIPYSMTKPPTGPIVAKVMYYTQNVSMAVYGGGIAVSGYQKLNKS